MRGCGVIICICEGPLLLSALVLSWFSSIEIASLIPTTSSGFVGWPVILNYISMLLCLEIFNGLIMYIIVKK